MLKYGTGTYAHYALKIHFLSCSLYQPTTELLAVRQARRIYKQVALKQANRLSVRSLPKDDHWVPWRRSFLPQVKRELGILHQKEIMFFRDENRDQRCMRITSHIVTIIDIYMYMFKIYYIQYILNYSFILIFSMIIVEYEHQSTYHSFFN